MVHCLASFSTTFSKAIRYLSGDKKRFCQVNGLKSTNREAALVWAMPFYAPHHLKRG